VAWFERKRGGYFDAGATINAELSGYDIAMDSTPGVYVEEAWMYWLTLLAGLFCLAIFFLVRTTNAHDRIRPAFARLAAGVIGFIPLLNIWANVKRVGSRIEILYGGWITALGYLGLFASLFLDLRKSPDKQEHAGDLTNRVTDEVELQEEATSEMP